LPEILFNDDLLIVEFFDFNLDLFFDLYYLFEVFPLSLIGARLFGDAVLL